MRYSLIFFFLFFFNKTIAYEIKCSFEEVYQNGDVKNGLVYYKNDRLRYEYFDQTLFTLIHKKDTLYIVHNYDSKKFDIINDQNLISNLMSIMQDYPNFQNKYFFADKEIGFEKNYSNNFIKRLIIKSNNLNMSIYFNNCNEEKINNYLFNVTTFRKN